ncbi:MAG: DUF1207 domain-containing protein [Thermoguttaceae bacterium]
MPCRSLIALVGLVGLLGAWTPAWGQIQAMPPSVALDQPEPALEPATIYQPPGLDPSLGKAAVPPAAGLFATPGLPAPLLAGEEWTWQLLPSGLIYRPYLGSGREPRLAGHFVREQDQGWLLDATVGGRAGLLRYGTQELLRPEGWQLDFEASAFPRLALNDRLDLLATDYRYGPILAFGRGMVEARLAYYHSSSHWSDEYLALHPAAVGNGYSRDAFVWGLGLRPAEDLRLYAEAGWGFRTKGPGEPWEFQFGADFSPVRMTGWRGTPFFAIHGRIREEVDYGGSITVQAGWQWRGRCGQLLRTGLQYFNGKSEQAQFLNEHEQQIGIGLWYDFANLHR